MLSTWFEALSPWRWRLAMGAAVGAHR